MDFHKGIICFWHFWLWQKVGKITTFHTAKALSQKIFLVLSGLDLKKTILILLAISFTISNFPDDQATFLHLWLHWWYTGIVLLPINVKGKRCAFKGSYAMLLDRIPKVCISYKKMPNCLGKCWQPWGVFLTLGVCAFGSHCNRLNLN